MRKIKNRFGSTKRYLLKILGISFVISSAFLLLATASLACTISGYVKLNSSTSPGLAGVTMGGLPGNPVTNSSGYYSATVSIGQTYTVTPQKTGYNFNPASRTYTKIYTSQSNQNYTATLKTFTLTYTAGTNGTISGTSPQTVNYGGNGTAVTAVPNTGYHFVNWSDGSTANPRTDTNVTTNISVTANFTINTYTISVNKMGSGIGTVASLDGGINCGYKCSEFYNHGTEVTLIAQPDACSDFTGWSGNCSGIGDCVITMDDAKTVSANFTLKSFTITATAGNGGNIDPSGDVIVNCGSDKTFTITPKNIGYKILDVLVDGSSVGAVPSYTFYNVIKDYTINATFIPIAVTTMRQETVEDINICTANPDPVSGCPQLVYSCLDETDVWVQKPFSEIAAQVGSIEWIGTGPDPLCPPVDIVVRGSTCVTRCYPSGYCYVGPRGCTEPGGSSASQTASLMTTMVEQTPWVATTTLRQETIAGIEICSDTPDESGCPTRVYLCSDPNQTLKIAQFSQITVSQGHLEWVGIGSDPVCPTVDIVTGSTTKCVKKCYPSGYCYVVPTDCTP
ncbi:MAG: hypothetical protein HXY44_10040 [Syntrophaceae bacterium]|nr:hypothetical protein [Syntrophaceae bacterium]